MRNVVRFLRNSAVCFLLISCAFAGRTPWDISVSEAATQWRRTDSYLLDVRSPAEFKKEHIEGAISMPVDEIEKRLIDLPRDKDREMVVYDATGVQSARATKILQNLGYRHARNLKGGLLAWKRKEKPVVK